MKVSEALRAVNEGYEVDDLIGYCKFCGQSFMMTIPTDWNQEDLNEACTESCKCDKAKAYTYRKERLENADEVITQMFEGEEKEEEAAMMKQAAVMVFDGKINTMSMDLGKGLDVRICRGKNDGIKIIKKMKKQEVQEA